MSLFYILQTITEANDAYQLAFDRSNCLLIIGGVLSLCPVTKA